MKNLKAYIFSGSNEPTLPMEIGVTVLRVFAGLSFGLAHGLGKVPPSDQLVEIVAGMGFPFPVLFAWAAALVELFGGIFVGIGLATRASAFFALFTMIVAAFMFHSGDPFHKMELSLLYLAILFMFTFKGAGRFSIDRFIRKG